MRQGNDGLLKSVSLKIERREKEQRELQRRKNLKKPNWTSWSSILKIFREEKLKKSEEVGRSRRRNFVWKTKREKKRLSMTWRRDNKRMVSNRRTKKKRDEGQESEGTDFELEDFFRSNWSLQESWNFTKKSFMFFEIFRSSNEIPKVAMP